MTALILQIKFMWKMHLREIKMRLHSLHAYRGDQFYWWRKPEKCIEVNNCQQEALSIQEIIIESTLWVRVTLWLFNLVMFEILLKVAWSCWMAMEFFIVMISM
jgi:hypothetical protein